MTILSYEFLFWWTMATLVYSVVTDEVDRYPGIREEPVLVAAGMVAMMTILSVVLCLAWPLWITVWAIGVIFRRTL